MIDNIKSNKESGRDSLRLPIVSAGAKEPVFYTLPNEFVKKHPNKSTTWQKVMLKNHRDEIEQYEDEEGFEQIAKVLGASKPLKKNKNNK